MTTWPLRPSPYTLEGKIRRCDTTGTHGHYLLEGQTYLTSPCCQCSLPSHTGHLRQSPGTLSMLGTWILTIRTCNVSLRCQLIPVQDLGKSFVSLHFPRHPNSFPSPYPIQQRIWPLLWIPWSISDVAPPRLHITLCLHPPSLTI